MSNLEQLRRDAEYATTVVIRAATACAIADDKARDARWHHDRTLRAEKLAWDKYCEAKNREDANTGETP